ncbi:MAG TPA: CDP-alcohol phosphatidyltransferase family protein [Acidimicrobiales bacterium]|nr:CDP-alcohol phosphatidyltransferase family protein [Acidimicrobiales bacterium]
MFDGRFREQLEKGMKPVGSNLGRTGITADQLTCLGLAFSVATAVAVAGGRLLLGVVLLALSAIPDMLDGAVAKASGTASKRGAFFDSVVDRVSDALVLGGIAWYLGSVDGGHAPVLAMAVLAASLLVSYERARAESLGYTARGGLMERAERIVLIGIGLTFSVALVPVLWVMLVLTLVTAGQRFAKVWRQASAELVRPPRPESRWRLRPQARRQQSPTRSRHRRQGAGWARRARTRP